MNTICIVCHTFQQAVISIAHQLVVSLLVAEVVCASNDSAFKARLLSSTLFMTGFTTLLMVTLGVRYALTFDMSWVQALVLMVALISREIDVCLVARRFLSCIVLVHRKLQLNKQGDRK